MKFTIETKWTWARFIYTKILVSEQSAHEGEKSEVDFFQNELRFEKESI